MTPELAIKRYGFFQSQIYQYVLFYLAACPEFKELVTRHWGDLSHALEEWSDKKKNGLLDKWKQSTVIIAATATFAISTDWLKY